MLYVLGEISTGTRRCGHPTLGLPLLALGFLAGSATDLIVSYSGGWAGPCAPNQPKSVVQQRDARRPTAPEVRWRALAALMNRTLGQLLGRGPGGTTLQTRAQTAYRWRSPSCRRDPREVAFCLR